MCQLSLFTVVLAVVVTAVVLIVVSVVVLVVAVVSASTTTSRTGADTRGRRDSGEKGSTAAKEGRETLVLKFGFFFSGDSASTTLPNSHRNVSMNKGFRSKV